MSRKTPHTATRRGKLVRIELRSGTVVIGKFKDREAHNYVLLMDGTRIRCGDISRFTPIQGRTYAKKPINLTETV